MVTIKNSKLTATINPKGAELWNLIKNGKEYLWQGNPKYWKGRAYNLFPICGGLIDDEFYFNNEKFTLTKHGFAKDTVFSVESQSDTKAVFLLTNKDITVEYPFEFEFRVIYELDDDKLNVYYKIKNIGNTDMFCSCGAHEGYALTGDIKDYCLIFEENDTPIRYLVDGNILTDKTEALPFEDSKLPLTYDFFDIDALIFKDHKSRKIELLNQKTGESILVTFKDFDYLLIWTVKDGGYVCIEPWSGLPDTINSNKKIENKEGITKISQMQEKEFLHTILIDGKIR